MDHANTPRRAQGLDGLRELLGHSLGPTTWRRSSAEVLERFSGLVGRVPDAPEIVVSHALACGPALSTSLLAIEGFSHGVNYGYDSVSVDHTPPAGASFRMSVTVQTVEGTRDGTHLVLRHVYQDDTDQKPFCVAEAVTRLFD